MEMNDPVIRSVLEHEEMSSFATLITAILVTERTQCLGHPLGLVSSTQQDRDVDDGLRQQIRHGSRPHVLDS